MSDKPDNNSVTGSAAAFGRAKRDEADRLEEALSSARANLASWQTTGNARRIEEAEENVAYLERLVAEAEEAGNPAGDTNTVGGGA